MLTINKGAKMDNKLKQVLAKVRKLKQSIENGDSKNEVEQLNSIDNDLYCLISFDQKGQLLKRLDKNTNLIKEDEESKKSINITLDLNQLYALNKLLDKHKKSTNEIELDNGEIVNAYKLEKTIRNTIVYNEDRATEIQ